MSSEFLATKAVGQLKQQQGLKHNLRELVKDEARNERMFKEFGGVCMDFSRQLLDKEGLDLLLELAKERKVTERVQQMFSGEKINNTEKRSVLHVALRMPKEKQLMVGGQNVVDEVHKVLDQIRVFAGKIRDGTLKGATGETLTSLICVGIGGSYLGSEFIVESLKTEPIAAKAAEGRTIRFLANVDPIDVARATAGLRPETTLVVIVSKTFTTAETMLNARSLKQWLAEGLKGDKAIGNHLCAVSTNLDLTAKFGITADRVFGFWDWVGCHEMDQHFLTAPPEQNLPMLMGLVSVYNASILDLDCVAVLPYCQAMHRFAAHIQQLTMESNGKGVDFEGQQLKCQAGEIYFGEPGTNGQHSFYQLLHQGRIVPAELIGFRKSQNPINLEGEEVSNHDELMCNFFAQPDALAFGKTPEELKQEGVPAELIPHKTFTGNRPSTIVELGKVLAKDIRKVLSASRHGNHV